MEYQTSSLNDNVSSVNPHLAYLLGNFTAVSTLMIHELTLLRPRLLT